MHKYSYILLILIFLGACSKKQETAILNSSEISAIPHKTNFYADEKIELKFKTVDSNGIKMIFENAYGTIILKPSIKNSIITFTVPDFISRKTGLCHWSLLSNEKQKLEGSLKISPTETKDVSIESYLGPRSITAGKKDYSMHVIAPTDEFDNPLPEGTVISSIYQFGKQIIATPVVLKNLIGWKNIYSPLESGRILVMASCKESTSKEFTTIVYPANATDFKISYERNHDYADGNQVILFSTDSIKDEFGNIVSDGTLVSFVAVNARGVQLNAAGTTLNGIAKARLLHPYAPDLWKVKAYITGAAESNVEQLSFRAAVKDFQAVFHSETSTLKIFDIKSFMQQIAPDGIPIELKFFDSTGAMVMEDRTTSRLGEGSFILTKAYFEPGNYRIELNVAGLPKEMTISIP